MTIFNKIYLFGLQWLLLISLSLYWKEIKGSNVVVNGGAETGSMSGWTDSGMDEYSGWVVSATAPYSGNYSFTTLSSSIVSMSQSLSLILNAYYNVSFWVEAAAGSDYDLTLSVNGVVLTSLTNLPVTYSQYNSSFKAISTGETLEISASSTINNIYLDNISVDGVVNLVVNPGAEDGNVGWTGVGAEGDEISNEWGIAYSGSSSTGAYCIHTGSYAFVTTSTTEVLMSQNLTLVEGTKYSVSIYVADGSADSSLYVSIGSTIVISVQGLPYPGITYTGTYIAESSTETLSIGGSTIGDSAAICTDDVEVEFLDPPPTSKPTDLPTSKPSSTPSNFPTRQPSSSPTSLPSNQPSDSPSADPSGQPSEQPNSYPTSTPTTIPTSGPTQPRENIYNVNIQSAVVSAVASFAAAITLYLVPSYILKNWGYKYKYVYSEQEKDNLKPHEIGLFMKDDKVIALHKENNTIREYLLKISDRDNNGISSELYSLIYEQLDKNPYFKRNPINSLCKYVYADIEIENLKENEIGLKCSSNLPFLSCGIFCNMEKLTAFKFIDGNIKSFPIIISENSKVGISRALYHTISNEYYSLSRKLLVSFEENQLRDFLLTAGRIKPNISVFQKIFCLYTPIYTDIGFIKGFFYGICLNFFKKIQVATNPRISEDLFSPVVYYIESNLKSEMHVQIITNPINTKDDVEDQQSAATISRLEQAQNSIDMLGNNNPPSNKSCVIL